MSGTGQKKKKKERSPLEIAASLLSARPLSRAELKKKLHDRELSWTVAEQTVLDCERLGFINDPDTAESYVRSMRNRGDGARKIRMKLRIRGFKKDDVENAFLRDDESSERKEPDVAYAVLQRKKLTLEREENLLKRKNKALRILASRGFPPDAAFQALDRFFGRNDALIFEEPESSEFPEDPR